MWRLQARGNNRRPDARTAESGGEGGSAGDWLSSVTVVDPLGSGRGSAAATGARVAKEVDEEEAPVTGRDDVGRALVDPQQLRWRS